MMVFLIIYGILFYLLAGFIFMDWFNIKTFEHSGEFNSIVTNIFICLFWGLLVALLVIVVVGYVLWALGKKLFDKLFKKRKKDEQVDDDTTTENVTDYTDYTDGDVDSSSESDSSVE